MICLILIESLCETASQQLTGELTQFPFSKPKEAECCVLTRFLVSYVVYVPTVRGVGFYFSITRPSETHSPIRVWSKHAILKMCLAEVILGPGTAGMFFMALLLTVPSLRTAGRVLVVKQNPILQGHRVWPSEPLSYPGLLGVTL